MVVKGGATDKVDTADLPRGSGRLQREARLMIVIGPPKAEGPRVVWWA